MNERRTIIIPIASGKGGVGKTFLTANLSYALAVMGHHTVAVDMDLGGSNLHSFLGLPNRYPGIGDFIKARSAGLRDLLVPTDTSNLYFLPGEGRTPFMANIPYAQKQRLIRHIKNLPAEYILLDLGAGTSFNALDFFRTSLNGIMITTFEYPSIMSMLAFQKHFLLRAILRMFVKDQQILEMIQSVYRQPMPNQKTDMATLQSKIASLESEAGEKVKILCQKYRPRIIFNMGEHPEEIKISKKITKSLRDLLSLEADYFGFIFEDPSVRQSIKKPIPFLPNYPESMAAINIKKISERIVKFWNRPVDQSARRLLSQTWKVYEGRT